MSDTTPAATLVVRTDAGEAGPAAFGAAAFLFGIAAAALAVGAILWFGWPQAIDFKSHDAGIVAFFFALVAALLGGFFLARALLHTARWRKFGQSELQACEPRLGEAFAGTVRAARDLAPRGDFTVRLRCDNTTRHRNIKGDGTNEQTECLWEASIAVPAAERSGNGVPFTFDIPANGLATGSRGAAGRVSWTLDVRAPLEGLDYFAEFPIKMLSRRKSSATAATATPARRGKAFAGYAKPVSRWERFVFPVLLVLGAFLVAGGLYTTAGQVALGHGGVPATGHVVDADTRAVLVAVDGSGAPAVRARVPIGSNFQRWETGKAVRILCRELGAQPRGCQMETGGERWINTAGTLLVGLGMLAVAGWIRRRLRAAAPAAPV